MIDTLLPPCQSWPPSYSSSSSLILHRGGETFSFFAKWICPHVFGRGEKTPSPPLPRRAVLEASLTDITEGICTGGPGRTGMVCPFGSCTTSGREPVGDLGRQFELSWIISSLYFIIASPRQPHELRGRSTNSGQRIWADSPVPAQSLANQNPTAAKAQRCAAHLNAEKNTSRRCCLGLGLSKAAAFPPWGARSAPARRGVGWAAAPASCSLLSP